MGRGPGGGGKRGKGLEMGWGGRFEVGHHGSLEAGFSSLEGYNFQMGVHSAGDKGSESVSPATAGRGCVLAIDYGRRRIGLAISDALGLAARPLATLERKGRGEDLARLREIVREHEVKSVIVGHPLRMDGTAGDMAEEAERFARRVERALGLAVELVDERLTSWAADQWLAEHRELGRGRAKDERAAAILLEEYLRREQRNG